MAKRKKPTPKKRVAPKKRKPAKRKPAKKKVTMLSYSIRMIIPTVEFGNIQPEIIVKAGSVDEAHDFIIPHMNKLWKEYYLVNGRRPKSLIPSAIAPTPPTPVVPTPVATKVVPPEDKNAPDVTPVTYTPPKNATGDLVSPQESTSDPIPVDGTPTASPISSVALVKATQAIESCMSLEALQLIINQVKISVKLTEEDKKSLEPLLANKEIELNGKK